MKKYDLEKRTLDFSIQVIQALDKYSDSTSYQIVKKQVIRSATSIGANYREANGAESRRDFKHKIFISLKEARETKYWLEILMKVMPNKSWIKPLWNEANEFTLIFGKITTTCKLN